MKVNGLKNSNGGYLQFLDALASLDFKLSVSQGCFSASASTGLSELFVCLSSMYFIYFQFNLRNVSAVD